MRFRVVIRIAFSVPLELEEGAEVELGDEQARLTCRPNIDAP